ncbi:hypothetical protein [Burkholderia cepacia]|uniref:hypothetical protein n=1 Tax=Burkholderia cepacia TaxID=292 RepID=UPI002ABE73FE|nr:hypothetical protein [Burkholderia cepacia]
MTSIDDAVSAVRADQQADPSTAPVIQQQPYPGDLYAQAQDKQARSAGMSKLDYLGAMWRQDTWISGAIDHWAGNQLTPDESYNPYKEETWQDLTDGVWPEFQGQLAQATSAGQGAWIKQNILQKQHDLTNLSDLDQGVFTARTAAGLAFGLTDPINLVAMAASGGASVVLRGAMGVAEAAGAAARASSAIAGASRLRPLASGFGTAGVLGAAAEKLRQQYNFEDDSLGVLKAGLSSMAFSAPFVGLHFREQLRLQKAAGNESQAINAMAKQQAGVPLSPVDEAALTSHLELMQKAAAMEAGALDPSEYVNALKVPGAAPETFTSEQRAKYAEAFARHDAEQAALRGTQLDGLAADARTTQAAEHQRIADVLARVNGPEAQPTAMQEAFAKALGKKADDLTAKPSEGATASPDIAGSIDAPWAGQRTAAEELPALHGRHVWWDDGSGINEGRVIDENPRTGDLTVEHPETGAAFPVNRSDLHDLSPGYVEHKPVEGFLGGSIGAGQVAPVQGLWEQPTAMARLKVPKLWGAGKGDTMSIPIRWDYFAHLNQSGNSHLQRLGHGLVKDAIGLDPHEAQGWTASELKSHYRRSIGGRFFMEARHAYDDAIKARKLNRLEAIRYHRQFYEDVSRVARGDADVLHANPDIAPQLQQAAKAMQDLYGEMRKRMTKAGVVGAENLPDDIGYVNRVWRQDHIREAYAKYGDELYQKVANAINVPGMHGDAAKAKSFLDAVMKLEFSHAMQDIHLYSRDMVTLRDELAGAGLGQHEINGLVDLMFERRGTGDPNAGKAANLKHRMGFDENHVERMADGSTFKLSDLFENDARVLVDRYLNSMGGHLALAESGLRIRSRAEFQAIMRAADEEQASKAMTQGAELYKRNRQFAQDMYDFITGRPMSTQSFNRADRILAAVRSFTRSAMLGELGVQAGAEMKNAIALTTHRAFRLQCPTLTGILRSFRAGHVPSKQLARDIQSIWGFGLEHVSSYARQHELTDYTYDRGLTRYENLSNTVANAVDHFSGNSHVTAATRNQSARMVIQKHLDWATGYAEMSEKQRERMTHNGVSHDDQPDVHAALKKYTTADPHTGAAQEIDWERWSREQPDTSSKFQLLVSREVRDMIQDHDIGETIPFQHTTIGKVFTELKTFVLAGHAKQFLKSLHYRDSTSFVQWAYSFVGAVLEYSLQNSINYAHDPEKLKEKLAPAAMLWGAIPRMSVLGLLPNLMETVYGPISGGQTLFTSGTANTDNRNLFITPSMTQAGRVMSLATVTLGNLNPFSSAVTTQKDMRDALYALPGGNLYGMRNLNDIISSNFPKYKPRPEQ